MPEDFGEKIPPARTPIEVRKGAGVVEPAVEEGPKSIQRTTRGESNITLVDFGKLGVAEVPGWAQITPEGLQGLRLGLQVKAGEISLEDARTRVQRIDERHGQKSPQASTPAFVKGASPEPQQTEKPAQDGFVIAIGQASTKT